ncbi:P-loop containing nucleoside triphosphate hydrolase protein [Lentinus tigrinus ALCF2SS1-7]|uniref:P-loop containing nucleoside triphosphate hydrolase protein n=1 Tax=Lentinus tigrinus ALCF2SS1-6 TaxID=1328759 RepID=A0A5C2SQ13_9APHY|nr:P-loop containing nucleoside triphosphate hydrolase protein [Lentinus tigrinus ALCF2SS1-6]RPD79405.1 P-loop containing nucleoside triphosphate hydrolase protein [Lentinus tigrinus ALCF2SS1-7]
MFDLSAIQPSSQSQSKDPKGKGKEKKKDVIFAEQDDRLWIDIYEPTNEEELAVHKRKIQDVRQWLVEAFEGGPSGKLKKYRRILVLTGPAGTAKTATIRILSAELGCEILEWRNAMDDQFTTNEDDWGSKEHEGLAEKFRTFLTRAASCRPLFATPSVTPQGTQSSQSSRASQLPPSASESSTSSMGPSSSRRQLILLEDLPNILHAGTQASFHAALEGFVAASETSVAPVVLIISDAGLRGENPDEDAPRWRSRTKEAIDVRNVLPPSLLNSPYVTQISFNPIAASFMRSALKSMLDQHFSSPSVSGTRPTKEILDLIVESSHGDIRSAIMALQFACTADQKPQKQLKGSRRTVKTRGPSAAVMLEAVTRREQSLALFHLLGKIMYNKRKGDPPPQSASAKDIRRDQEIDSRLKDPPPLSPHLRDHERKASRVDVETLYADTPIDASLLSLYIHQNYTQYCNTVEECEALMDSLSWADASGGETWYQANPHQFHLVALGTLHALPTPVPRRNQKPYKPAFFENLKRQNEAEDGVRDVQAWLQLGNWPVSSWPTRDVALGAGTVLRVGESSGRFAQQVPFTHRAFSRLNFAGDGGAVAELADEDEPVPDVPEVEREVRSRAVPAQVDEDQITGKYLSDDDIEEW